MRPSSLAATKVVSSRDRTRSKIMLKVQTTNLGNVAVFCVQGRIVRGETEALRKAVLAQLNVNAVVLDLARVRTIDAGGVGLLLELRQHTESRGVEFRLKNVTKLVRQVLEITRLDEVFRIRTAVAAITRRPAVFATSACA